MTEARPIRWRLLLCGLLVGSWLFMLPSLWSAFATFPTPERLETSRLVRIPTLEALAWTAARSAAELAALLALLWPWWRPRYRLRIAAAWLGLVAYFLATVPLGVSMMVWVHRRWLAAVAGILLLALVASGIGYAVEKLRARRQRGGGAPSS
jgi:hypothetical protein